MYARDGSIVLLKPADIMHTDDTQLELSSKTNTSLWEYVVDASEWSKACDDRKVDDNIVIHFSIITCLLPIGVQPIHHKDLFC